MLLGILFRLLYSNLFPLYYNYLLPLSCLENTGRAPSHCLLKYSTTNYWYLICIREQLKISILMCMTRWYAQFHRWFHSRHQRFWHCPMAYRSGVPWVLHVIPQNMLSTLRNYQLWFKTGTFLSDHNVNYGANILRLAVNPFRSIYLSIKWARYNFKWYL